MASTDFRRTKFSSWRLVSHGVWLLISISGRIMGFSRTHPNWGVDQGENESEDIDRWVDDGGYIMKS
jgi:hypothetical protein